MAVLHNRISHKELREKMLNETFRRITISFYKYFSVSDPQAYRDDLYKAFKELDIFGRIYIAAEGINAQISVPEFNMTAFESFMDAQPEFVNLRKNIAVDDDGKSFFVLKIKVRDKIVADGLDDASFDAAKTGIYLNAKAYNELTEKEDVVIVDMRNHYEYEVGHFENAIEIPSDTFREQLPMAVNMLQDQKDKPIIMYCTGGIRCEKASAYMLHNGFKNVYHVEGGIIHYTRTAKSQDLPVKFIGKNFVFDERLGERISEEIIAKCHQCGQPADTHTNCKNEACHLLFIQCAACADEMNGCCSSECKDVLALPEEVQAEIRKGIDKGQMIFNKSREGKLRPRLDRINQI
ncbi:MAG: rhodanese-related sulfurtransferase [Chitinophagaceae bacterium]|nr:rhodanese-related sulfurtransferase [Chitinophagaceae bacterium]